MEHVSIFEKSYEEIQKLKKELLFDTVTIDFSKFDSRTRGVLKEALYNALDQRDKRVLSILSGVVNEACKCK